MEVADEKELIGAVITDVDVQRAGYQSQILAIKDDVDYQICTATTGKVMITKQVKCPDLLDGAIISHAVHSALFEFAFNLRNYMVDVDHMNEPTDKLWEKELAALLNKLNIKEK